MIEERIGGTATFTFQAEVDKCKKGEAIINRVNVTTADAAETAIAATKCVKDDDDSRTTTEQRDAVTMSMITRAL